MAAHKFLEDNELSPMFLDQVANFIMKNTEGVTLGQPQSSLSDPFTGRMKRENVTCMSNLMAVINIRIVVILTVFGLNAEILRATI